MLPSDECQLLEDVAYAIMEAEQYAIGTEDGPIKLAEHGVAPQTFWGSTDGLVMDFSSIRGNDDAIFQALKEAAAEGATDCKQRRSKGLPDFEEACVARGDFVLVQAWFGAST